MATKCPRRICIVKRDREIFDFLYRNKVASSQQIRDTFFSNANRKIGYRRLAGLANANFLKRIARWKGERASLAFSLTDKTFREFFTTEKESSSRKQFKSNSIEHDITLIDIQKRLKESRELVSYLTENELQSKAEFLACLPVQDFISSRTDAVIQLRRGNDDYFVGIEYEASLKFQARYRKKLMDYHYKQNIGTVIFICGDEQILTRIMDVEKKYCSNFFPKIYYCTLDNLLNRNRKMTFTNLKNEFFAIS